MEWLKRLGAAIDYIEENLDKEISYDEAAHIACCSTYYFQRIFSYVSGVSLSEYIRRRKMTQAAFELQRTDNKVIDVAHKYGYSSPTSFNRAFQSVHGIAPIAAKSMGCTLCAYPSIQFSIIVLGGSAMAYHIEEKKNIRIIGIRIPLVEDAEENMRNVPAFWKKAVLDGSISKLAELSNKNPDGILGVSVYNNPEDIYYYIAVSSNIPVPEGMVEYMIPEGMWVVFENDGVFKEDVQSVFRRFYRFLVMNMQDFQMLKYIQSAKDSHPKDIPRCGLQSKKQRRFKYVSFKIKRRPLSDGRKKRKHISKSSYFLSTPVG